MVSDIPTMKIMLLAFVGCCLCYDVRVYYDVTSHSLDLLKETLIFIDEHIVERLWSTEDLTCKEVHSVWQMFNRSIKADLSLLMKDAEKHLIQAPPPKNRKMRRCIGDIKERIEEIVQEGVDSFIVCTGISLNLQYHKRTEMEKKRDEYSKNINYTLGNLERCLEHSNTNSEVHRKRCIAKTVAESETQFKAACNVFLESQCMAHFTNDILECTSMAFNNIAANKIQLKEDIDRCVGYAYFDPEQQNFSLTIKNMLSYYTDVYQRLTNDYDQRIADYYGNLSVTRVQSQEYREQFHRDNLSRYLQAYHYALHRTGEENRSVRERKCSSQAIEKLKNLTAEGIKDYTECDNFTAQQTAEGVDSFFNIVQEFNTKLQEAGNVALLRCFGQRPQNIFNSEAIRQCAELASESISWEWSKAQIQLAILDESLQPIQIMPNNKTCGSLRESKLRLDADKILNGCTRCLYGGSGDFYAVTTPPSSTEQAEVAEQETPTDDDHMEGKMDHVEGRMDHMEDIWKTTIYF